MLDNCFQYTRLHIPQYSLNAIAINIEDIKFDPKQGSFLLRDNMKNYYTNEDKYYQ